MGETTLEVKTVVIGDTDVGKTSIACAYCLGRMLTEATPTIGASFLQKRVAVDSMEVSLQIWDTAGQERFRAMSQMYFRGAKAAILVFDVTNEETYKRLKQFYKDLMDYAEPDCVCVMVANKVDLHETFDLAQAEEYARSIGSKLHRTSAVTLQGVNAVFESVARGCLEMWKHRAQMEQRQSGRRLSKSGAQSSSSGGCC